MPRTKGAHATSLYKYKLIRDGKTTYYTSQAQMTRDNPTFNKSFVFKMIKCPEKLTVTKGVSIFKLETPIPINIKVRNIIKEE
jgi:hypothetical protein